MAVEWKGSFPLIMLLFAVAAVSFSGLSVTGGFVGSVITAVAWFLLIPVMSSAGVTKEANPWFVRAAAFALFAASFVLLQGTFIDVREWSGWLVQVGLILSWLMAFIGSLVALSGTK